MIGTKLNKAQSYTSSLIGCLLLLAISQSAFAFNFTVNSTDDLIDNSPGDGACETGPANGICTLRAAIQESNAWPGKDYIYIPSGTYTLSLPGADNTALAGDLDITDSVTLRGVSQSLSTIRANSNYDRILDIHGVDVAIHNLTIREGTAAGSVGGGVRNVGGALTILNSTFDSNQTTEVTGFGGGGLYNTGPLVIDNSTFINNRSSRGGGILHFSNDMVITNSRINDNIVDIGAGSGGGIFTQTDANTTISNTTIDGNTAALGGGGGIYSVYGLTLLNSTVSNNNALLVGGGGIYDIGLGPLTITNSTISSNAATGNGGGIQTRKSLTTITNSTIYNNDVFGTHVPSEGTFNGHGGGIYLPSGSSIVLNDTVIAGNTASIITPPGNNCYSQSDGGTFTPIMTISTNTIASDSSCELTGPGDQPNVDPSLTNTLETNGGPTLTHSLAPSSTAIDAGADTSSGCPSIDQRHFPRPVNGGGSLDCDVGSFEYDPAASVADLGVTIEDTMDPAINSSPFTYSITVTNHGPDTANNVVLTDDLGSGIAYDSNDSGCNAVALTVSCTLGVILAGDSRVVNITASPTAVGLLSNTATVSSSPPTETDPNTTNNSATETTDVSATSDLSVTIAGSIDPATADVAMSYIITITNNGPNTARSVLSATIFDDTLRQLSVTPDVGSCTPANSAALSLCELGDLPSGDFVEITVVAVPLKASLTPITHTAYASFNGYDPVVTNNIAPIDTTVDADATLSIVTIDAPDPAFQSADILYSFAVSNSGPSTTHNTQLVVTFPSGMSLSSAPGASPLNCSGAGTVTCDLESITAFLHKTVTLVAIADSVGPYTVVASATSDETPTPTTDTEFTQVNPIPASPPPVADLSITMTDSADPVVIGSNITYNVTATNNNGPNVAQSTVITVVLPASTQFVSASSSCTNSGNVVTCVIGSLGVNSSTTVTISAQTSSVGTFSAYASVSDSVGNDPELTNNTTLQSTKVNTSGSGGTSSPGPNSGGGSIILNELIVLLFVILVLFYNRRFGQAVRLTHVSR